MFKIVYIDFILGSRNFQRLTPLLKWICCAFSLTFETLNIGNLHFLVDYGFSNYVFWTNNLLNLLIDLDIKFKFTIRIIYKVRAKFFIKNKNNNNQIKSVICKVSNGMNNNHSMSIRNNDRNRNNMSFNRLPNIQRIYIGNIS